MTRSSLNRRLRMIYALCALILCLSLLARLARHIPGLDNSIPLQIAPIVSDYMRDMALVFVTMVAAYLANVFHKRTKFVGSLEEEWRAMVKTNASMVTYSERENTTLDDYLEVYERISATLDNMRIVYCNVGETDQLIGLYPYAPLHDMRRALESLDPRHGVISNEQRTVARAAIQQSFTALRETFLEELDIEQPTHGQLVSGARRVKRSGATRAARAMQRRQQRELAKSNNGAVDDTAIILLAEAYERERTRESAESVTRL